MNASFDVKGLDGLLEDLRKIPNELRVRVAQNAVNRGARVIRDEAKARVPVRTGRLRSSIRTFVRRSGVGRHSVVAAVGVRGGGKQSRVHIARFLEYGTRGHVIEPKSKRGRRKAALLLSMGVAVRRAEHPGAGPRPFLRPAYDAKKQEALNAMAASLRKGILRVFRKLNIGGGGGE